MKLKYFSEQTLPKMGGGRKGVAKVSFSSAGVILFNKEAAALMELKDGDKVTVSQDEEDPDNWYFFKDKQHGFELRPKKPDGFAFSHTQLINAILEARELPAGKTAKALIAGQPTIMKGDKAQTKYWGVLFRPA